MPGAPLRRFRVVAALGIVVVGLGLGFGLGLGTKPEESLASCSRPMQVASSVLGWTYFAAWSISFYPQILLNAQRRSVVGLSLDYTALNVVGFACYASFNVALSSISAVRAEYAETNNGRMPIVQPSDVFFSLHALLLSAVCYLQTLFYPRGGQTVSRWVQLAVAAFGVALLVGIPLVSTGACAACTWLNLLYAVSYVKLAITCSKYVPQVLLNWRRRSTVGWTIENVVLDMTGGLLSLVQELMDAGCSGDWSAIAGDPVKFGLGLTSIVFDSVFMAQHFCLYPEPPQPPQWLVDAAARDWLAEEDTWQEEGAAKPVVAAAEAAEAVEALAERRAPLLVNSGVQSDGGRGGHG